MTKNQRTVIGFKAFSSWHKCSPISSSSHVRLRLAGTAAWLYLKAGYWEVGRCWKGVQGHTRCSSGRCLYLIFATSSSSVKGWHWQKQHKDLPFFFARRRVISIYHLCDGKKRKRWRKENVLQLKTIGSWANIAVKWEILNISKCLFIYIILNVLFHLINVMGCFLSFFSSSEISSI